jgi:hypothetical protein
MKSLDNIYEEKMLSHLPDPIDILRSDRICTPNWLKNFKPHRPFPIKKFLGSRVVYYPASGVDFHPVEVFGSAGAASCFVMADYIIPKNDFQSFIRNSWGLVKGYELSYFEELPIGLVLKSKWERHFFPSPDEQDFIRHFQAPERYAFVGTLDSHTASGLERLAFLFLGCEAIEVYGNGQMARDFTYIDDIVDGIIGSLDHPPARGEHRVLNIGDSHPVGLMEMIETLEKAIGREATKVMRPMQPGDVTATYADVSKLHALTGYKPKVMLAEGLQKFADWYRQYYGAAS